MKIFISSDMEGTAGVVDWEQVLASGPRYEYYCELLLNEVNAAILGAADAGATEFLVNDSHSKMANLRLDALEGHARYLSGRLKPWYMMQGLDSSFDAIFFVSYHGSMGSAGSNLSHTYFPSAFAEVTINGVVAGESGINALVAQAFGVPIVLITGDETTARELAPFAPTALSAVVKTSVTRFAADSLHPDDACQLIREQARRAVASLESMQKVSLSLPIHLRMSFRTSDYTELACRVAGVTRVGTLAADIVGDDPLEIFRTFITVVLLCRGFVE
ncbi:MAG: M55 family metallopeptidase [Acidobacteria bacterium]|nr:M55 family metallopeptidase [Acidobacteriota bacterium]